MDFIFSFLSDIHWVALSKIILMDIILGGDNAIIIGMACASIPIAQRQKAIFLGTAAAIILRILVLGFAAYIIDIPYLKLVAGVMLVWIGYKLLNGDGGHGEIEPKEQMWAAIKTIAVADLIMSIDNVFAITAASQGVGEHSFAYAVFGVLLSIPIIIFGSTLISRLMERYKIITWIGAGMLGWVGGEMIAHDPVVHGINPLLISAVAAALVIGVSLFKKKAI